MPKNAGYREAAVAGDDLGFQHRPSPVAKQQIDVADDAGIDLRRAVAAARAHRRNAIGELDLADRAERFRTILRYIERQST